jgi:hypothetical protein
MEGEKRTQIDGSVHAGLTSRLPTLAGEERAVEVAVVA